MSKHKWVCPQCQLGFGTDLELKTPPTCFQHKGGRTYAMTCVDKQKPNPDRLSPNGGGGLQGEGEPDPKGDGA